MTKRSPKILSIIGKSAEVYRNLTRMENDAILIVYTKCIKTLMEFEWDENKNRQNQQKHGISFEEAREIFFGIVFTSIDERFDYDEIREVSVGAIQEFVIVTVAHTERNGKIRLISARKATPKERRQYYEYLTQAP